MKRIAVIGAGTMGHGIAQVAALAGFTTTLTDAEPASLPRAVERIKVNLAGGVSRGKLSRDAADAALERLSTSTNLTEAVQKADLIVEAIVEDLGAKQSLFAAVENAAGASAVLATNTSSLSIAAIAQATDHPERVLGMHFFNPVHIMKLVELVTHDGVDAAVVERVRDVAVRMGKEPIIVKNSPGFASSRLGIALGLEAMRMVEEGVATPEDIDKALELGYGHPMGPLRVSDLVGLDVRLSIAEYLHAELGAPHFAPPDILRRLVRDNHLGKKTGRGFYEWPKNVSS